MTRLIFATTNHGKLANMRAALAPAGFGVEGLEDFGTINEVPEVGTTAEENARLKAEYYARETGQPVISMDSALYFYNVEDKVQPGVNVRRIPGAAGRPTDDEVARYYGELIRQRGGELIGYWEYALAYAQPNGTVTSQVARTEDRILRYPGSTETTPGQPLESYQIYGPTGQYLSEMTEAEKGALWHETGEVVLQLVRQLIG